MFKQQALADVRSTGVGIKYLYCACSGILTIDHVNFFRCLFDLTHRGGCTSITELFNPSNVEATFVQITKMHILLKTI